MNNKERQTITRKLAHRTGLTQKAILDRLNDEEMVLWLDNIETLSMVKKVADKARYNSMANMRSQRDEALEKLSFFEQQVENSELVKLGKWLSNALSLTGKERKTELQKQKIYHQDDVTAFVDSLDKDHEDRFNRHVSELQRDLERKANEHSKLMLAVKERFGQDVLDELVN